MHFTLPSGLLSLAIILFGTLSIISCGSDGGGGGTTVAEPLVSDTIKAMDSQDTIPDAEIEVEPSGLRIARTKMMIVFKPTATSQQMHDLLASLNATITRSIAGTRSVVVRISDPGSLDAYRTIVASVEAEPYVDFVWEGEMPQPQELPDNFTVDPTDPSELDYIKNHLAIRGPAAWNLRNAINATNPKVLVADYFGNGDPFNNTVNINNMGVFLNNANASSHGYHVLGIIAARYGIDFITGIYPSTADLYVLDLTIGNDIPTTMLDIIGITGLIPGKVVVNASIGYHCTGVGGNCIDINKAEKRAMLWIEYNRDFGLENKALYVTSAGNLKNPPGFHIRDAATSHYINSGGLLGSLVDISGNHVLNLTNTIVVENGLSYDPELWVINKPKCLSEWSFVGGNLMGIGEDVWSYLDASGTVGLKSGTSMSAPQVAGMAAYLWAVDPSLTPQQIKGILTKTSNPMPASGGFGCSDWANPAPAVNAYEALLSLDSVTAPTPVNSPLRLALLDVNEDGSFDENDLSEFIIQYYGDLVVTELIVPAGEEYGRYDLNADGYNGGSAPTYADKFDLDRSGSQQYGQPTYGNASFVIDDLNITYNEQSVTDMDIVCYYGYSSLYTGDTEARDDLLTLDRCAEVIVINDTPLHLGDPEDGTYGTQYDGTADIPGEGTFTSATLLVEFLGSISTPFNTTGIDFYPSPNIVEINGYSFTVTENDAPDIPGCTVYYDHTDKYPPPCNSISYDCPFTYILDITNEIIPSAENTVSVISAPPLAGWCVGNTWGLDNFGIGDIRIILH